MAIKKKDSDLPEFARVEREEMLRGVGLGREGIRPISNPLAKEGGLMFLEGSLAPEGALVKKAGVPGSMHQFKGPALLFETEDEAGNALMAGEIAPGSVVVVRGIGPAGDPSMRLLQRFLWLSAAKGMMDKIAIFHQCQGPASCRLG